MIRNTATKEILTSVIKQYNEWPYRLEDIELQEYETHWKVLMDLGDFPVFWGQFLEDFPEIKKELKAPCIDGLGPFIEKDPAFAVGLNKALATLEASKT